MKHIIKRAGHKEPYDNHKVYASIYAACLNAHMSVPEAELIAQKVTASIDDWISDKETAQSDQLARVVRTYLQSFHEDASYQYIHHRDQ